MAKENRCTHPEAHQEHLCELEKRLTREELNRLRKNPRYVCAHCGGKVSEAQNLCVPKRIRD